MTAGRKERKERKGWARGGRGKVEGGDEARRERVSLHMMHADQRNLPGYRKTFGGIDTRGEVGAHSRAPGYGDKVGLQLPVMCPI